MNAPRRYITEPGQLDIPIPAVFKPIGPPLAAQPAEPSLRDRLQQALDNAIHQAEVLHRALAQLDAADLPTLTDATTERSAR